MYSKAKINKIIASIKELTTSIYSTDSQATELNNKLVQANTKIKELESKLTELENKVDAVPIIKNSYLRQFIIIFIPLRRYFYFRQFYDRRSK